MNKDTFSMRNDPEVFESMGIFEMGDSSKHSWSIRLQFAKFAHGFTVADFEEFIKSIGDKNVSSVGRLSYPNEWQMTLTSQTVREELIRLARTRINCRTCWIHPLSNSEVRGHVHWLPSEIPHFNIIQILKQFGEVLFMETLKYSKFNHQISSDMRYFGLYLKPGTSKDDVPHFIQVSGKLGLVIIRGRQPACFHCKQIGHRKSECKQYREKLGEYCLKKAGTASGRKRRGRRHKKVKPHPVKADNDSKEESFPLPESGEEKTSESVEIVPDNIPESPEVDAVKTSKKTKKKKKKSKKKKFQASSEGFGTQQESKTEAPDVKQECSPVAFDVNLDRCTVASDISFAPELEEKDGVNVVDNCSGEQCIEKEQSSQLSNSDQSNLALVQTADVKSAAEILPSENLEVSNLGQTFGSELKKSKDDVNYNPVKSCKELPFIEECSDKFEVEKSCSGDFEEKSVEILFEKAHSECAEKKSLKEDFKNGVICSAPISVCEMSQNNNSMNSSAVVMNMDNISKTHDVVLKMRDCSTNTENGLVNHFLKEKEEKSNKVKHQIYEILQGFVHQLADVLCEADITNKNDIQNKLIALSNNLFSSNALGDNDVKDNECDKNVAMNHDFPDGSKSDKRRKKKKKMNLE